MAITLVEYVGKTLGKEQKKRHWAFIKPKLDNARTWRGISYIHLDDMEFKDTIDERAQKVGSATRIRHALREF